MDTKILRFELTTDDLRQRIRAAGFTQANFAIMLGVDPSTVRRWIAGLRKPSDRHLLAMADLLNLKPPS